MFCAEKKNINELGETHIILSLYFIFAYDLCLFFKNTSLIDNDCFLYSMLIQNLSKIFAEL